jgi:hypothetical protein
MPSLPPPPTLGGAGVTVPKGLLALKRLFYAMGGPAEEGIFRIAGTYAHCLLVPPPRISFRAQA